jgi:hypothetical protein
MVQAKGKVRTTIVHIAIMLPFVQRVDILVGLEPDAYISPRTEALNYSARHWLQGSHYQLSN